MKKSLFVIPEMCCPTEEQMIRNRLRSVTGVQQLEFDLINRELSVTHGLEDDSPVLEALVPLGMGACRKEETASVESGVPNGTPRIIPAVWITMGLSGSAAFAAEILALATGKELSYPVVGLALFSIVIGGSETLRKGILSVRTLTLNINFLMAVAIIGAALIGQFPEAAMVTFLFGVAERIEAYSLDRARNAIRALMQIAPETAFVQDDTEGGAWREVRAAEVKVGQIVRVRPGERVALDGTVEAGRSAVNQAPITGESVPVTKLPGDRVFAGTVNERGTFDFQVTAAQGETTLDRIARAVQQAQGQRAPTQRFIDQFARFYTPAVFAFAIAVALVPPLLLHAPLHQWLYRGLVLLVVGCPCALVISTPVTVVSGLAAAARRGILIKGGAYLEQGRKIKAIAIDKTGTLTQGKPEVTDIVPLAATDEEHVLRIAASLEAPSEHPVASAIVARLTGKPAVPAPASTCSSCCNCSPTVVPANGLLPVSNFQALPGRGVCGRIKGIAYDIGSKRFAAERGALTQDAFTVLDRLENEGKTAVVLTSGSEALAVFGVADTLRETSREAIADLHRLGIKTVMLTGDNEATANAIATQVGIGAVRANLLPEDKLAAVKSLQGKFGRVGMVGDGVNDAPALATADLGIAMGIAGTDTALETADVALMEDDLRKLPAFIRLSHSAGRILAQNIAFAIVVKIIFFALALTGKATLWMAVFADMGSSLIVVFNGLRILSAGHSMYSAGSVAARE